MLLRQTSLCLSPKWRCSRLCHLLLLLAPLHLQAQVHKVFCIASLNLHRRDGLHARDKHVSGKMNRWFFSSIPSLILTTYRVLQAGMFQPRCP